MPDSTIENVTRLRRACRYAKAELMIKEDVDGPAAEVELGRIAFQRKRFPLAAGHFDRALTIDPEHEAAKAWQVAVLSARRRTKSVTHNTCSTRSTPCSPTMLPRLG